MGERRSGVYGGRTPFQGREDPASVSKRRLKETSGIPTEVFLFTVRTVTVRPVVKDLDFFGPEFLEYTVLWFLLL